MQPDRRISSALSAPAVTANDRFKRRVIVWQSNAIVAAVAIHFGVLALWPTMSVAVPIGAPEPAKLLPAPELDIPEAPKRISRPALPVIVPNAPDRVTPAPWQSVWKDLAVTGPPPARETGKREDFQALIPSMLAPRLKNAEEVERALARHYPTTLRDAGIGGNVEVLMWLDETGAIVRAEIGRSSGYEPLDRAALEVVKVMRLEPARNQNRPVRVIVVQPIAFSAR